VLNDVGMAIDKPLVIFIVIVRTICASPNHTIVVIVSHHLIPKTVIIFLCDEFIVIKIT